MSTESDSRTRNATLSFALIAIVAVVAFRLFNQANETGNWEGLWFSLSHVLFVSAGSWFILRN